MSEVQAVRKKRLLCKCNCGEPVPEKVINDALSRGQEPKYVNPTHRRRQQRRNERAK
jgi:hypothetical protein